METSAHLELQDSRNVAAASGSSRIKAMGAVGNCVEIPGKQTNEATGCSKHLWAEAQRCVFLALVA
jgi:hypothetical protein